MGLYGAILTSRSWVEAKLGMAALNSDQINIGTAIAKELNPQLFARDYAFHDLRLWELYTPAALFLFKQLWIVFDSYEMGLAFLIPVLFSLYVVGMYKLGCLVTGNQWVALGVAVVSTVPRASIGAEWGIAGITGLEMVLPRSLFLALTPWLFLIFLRRPHGTLMTGLIIGGAVGLMANLHPVSGLASAQILGLIALGAVGEPWAGRWKEIVGLVVGAGLGASPMILAFTGGLQRIAKNPAGVSFDRFAGVVRERLATLFPFKASYFSSIQISAGAQEVVVWLYLSFLAVMAVTWWSHRSHPQALARMWVIFWLGQLPIAYLVTLGYGTALVLVAAAYVMFWRIDEVDRLLASLMVTVAMLAWVGSYVLMRIWMWREAWSLTVFMAEQVRMSGFIYLPLYLILARFSARFLRAYGAGVDSWGLVLALWCVTRLTPVHPYSALAVLLVAWLSLRPSLAQANWCRAVMTGTWVGAIAWAGAFRLGFAYAEYWALAPALMAGGLRFVTGFAGSAVFDLRYLTMLMAGFALFAGVTMGGIFSRDWVLAISKTVGAALLPKESQALSSLRRDLTDLTQWARQNTDQQALFYFNSPEFRFKAQRSITHSWKDLGAAYLSRAFLVDFYERYWSLQRALNDPAKLVRCAESLGAEYIILPSRQPGPKLPVVYRNVSYIVYILVDQHESSERLPGWTSWPVPPACR